MKLEIIITCISWYFSIPAKREEILVTSTHIQREREREREVERENLRISVVILQDVEEETIFFAILR